MCGIVGYIGARDALPIIISGLEKLEYRGYDSTGVAILEDGHIRVGRAVGKLAELKKVLTTWERKGEAHLGIGHTRWATHGRPSETNAHPHTAGRVSLIHNGIIENYAELREKLQSEGCQFKSETDTEIAAHLLSQFLEAGQAPFEALKETCKQIRGSYAFVALDSAHPDRLLVAKNSTPIVVGLGKGESIVASGIPALLEYTRDIVVLEDGDIAEIKADSMRVENDGHPVTREMQHVTWDPVTAQKGGYKHFMLKEIYEQPQVVSDTFRGRIKVGEWAPSLSEISLSEKDVASIDRIILLGCGTAWHACLVAKFYFEELTGIPCEVDYASEFRYRSALFDERTLVLAISQSGETADTLAAIDLVSRGAKGKAARTLSICNVLGSSLARKVRSTLFTHAGPEISVASTKAFTTQLVAALLIAMDIGLKRSRVSQERTHELIEALFHVPACIDEALKTSEVLESVARAFHRTRGFLFLGRGICYPVALEGALKLKEISYIHAEGYPAGEMKHGPIALIDEDMPVVVVIHKSEALFEKTMSNLKEVESRGGQIIAVTDAIGHPELKKVARAVIEVPHVHEFLSPVICTVPLQLLAYHVAVFNGTDVDLPRNLAKSVTVE